MLINIQRTLLAVLTPVLVILLVEQPIHAHKELAQFDKKAVSETSPISASKFKQLHPLQENVAAKEETQPVVNHQDWLNQAGISQADWAAVDFIISHESTWRPNAVNASSGATGLCQALPATKMQSAGLDYMTNPVTQLRWCNQYAHDRYGGWQQAMQFWQANHWW